MPLLDIPPDLLIRIFIQTSVQDILRCTMTCAHLRNVVQGSTQLRYTIELVRTGYADGGEKAIPPGDKLRRLRVLDRAWGDLGFTPSSRVKLPGPTVFYDLREGVLLRCSSSELSIIRIPTHFGTNRERRWSLGDLGLERNICASSVDPAKDLLVLIEGRDGIHAPYRVHLLTMSGGKPHPDSILPTLTHHALCDSPHTFIMTIMRDVLAIMFSSTDPDADPAQSGELVIWDWTQGDVITSLAGRFPRPSSFSFINPTSFMIPVVHGVSDVVLEVYVIPRATRRYDVVPCQLVASFLFPAFTDRVESVQVTTKSGPEPAASTKIFDVDPLKRVFAIALSLRLRGKAPLRRTTHEAYTIFVHSDAFHKLANLELLEDEFDVPSNDVHWGGWSKFTRWTTVVTRHDSVSQTYGQRFIDYESGPYVSRMHLWDFNPHAAQVTGSCKPVYQTTPRPISSADQRIEAGYLEQTGCLSKERHWRVGSLIAESVSETDPTVIRNKDAFRDKEVWSSLPYRRVTGRDRLPNLTGIMIDEERIVLINSTASTLELTVLGINEATSIERPRAKNAVSLVTDAFL